jgi:hypothetical protein
MVPAAEYFICDFIGGANVANNNLFTFGDHLSADGTGVMCGPRSTPAKSFDLQGIHAVC